MKRAFCGLFASTMMLSCVMTVSAAPDTVIKKSVTTVVTDGAELEVIEAVLEDTAEMMYVLTAPGDKFAFEIGGTVGERSLVTDATLLTPDDGEQVVAALNGDHFSFATGIPLGMSISDGRLLTSPIPPYNADDYYFHALGITADGKVLTGENPTMRAVCTIDGQELVVDRINRTRENWEGGQVCVFTPDYGASTGTDVMGVEAVIRVTDGFIGAGQTLGGVIERIADGNDTAIEDGTVVLSMHLLCEETEWLKEGAEISLTLSFEEEEWNDVVFAVGGNLTIVNDGAPVLFDYTVGAFTAPQPRSAIGVREDGTLVMAAVDGRSELSGGLTANKMAEFMAVSLECTHAILLDGGGSTAMAVMDATGVLQTVNVPSEQRPVGNTVLLVKQAVPLEEESAPATTTTAPATTTTAPAKEYKESLFTTVLFWLSMAVVGAMVCGVVVQEIRKRKNHGKNDQGF